jgi:ABC-2 type transport system permease protein
MLQLTLVELYKIITKPRSYIGFLAVTAVIFLVQFALYLQGESYISFLFQSMQQTFQMQGNILNGNQICFIILQMLIMQMPLMVALVTGDLISGEAATGTIRLLASKPFSRVQILMAKYLAGTFYTICLVAWLGILALGVSRLIFGDGDLIVIKSESLTILRSTDVVWRFMAAFLIAIISLVVVSTFAMMLSCFTDNSIGPIIISMSVIIVFTIIGTIEVPIFDTIKPFLFTTHMIIWRNMFDNPLNKIQIVESISVLLLHIAAFLGISIYHFHHKDIQS